MQTVIENGTGTGKKKTRKVLYVISIALLVVAIGIVFFQAPLIGILSQSADAGADSSQAPKEFSLPYGHTAETVYYDDGSYTVYEHGEDGRLVKDSYYFSDDTIGLLNEYDSLGNNIRRLGYGADGTIELWHDSEYGEDDKLARLTAYYADGSIIFWYGYEYDSSGLLVKQTTYHADSSLAWWNEFEYDDAGNTIVRKEFTSDGSLAWRNEYVHDADGYVIKEVGFDSEGELSWWDEYEYDDTGEVTKRVYYNADGTIRYQWP